MWFSLSFVLGIYQGATGKKYNGPLLALSFAIMILAPLWYWILRIAYIKGKEENKNWLMVLPVVVWWLTLLLIVSAGLSRG